MTRALMTHTQPAVILSLSIVPPTAASQMITLPLVNLTPLLVAVWQGWQWLDGLTTEAAKLAARLVFSFDRLALWLTLALILLAALWWALPKTPVQNPCSKPLPKTSTAFSGASGGFEQ